MCECKVRIRYHHCTHWCHELEVVKPCPRFIKALRDAEKAAKDAADKYAKDNQSKDSKKYAEIFHDKYQDALAPLKCASHAKKDTESRCADPNMRPAFKLPASVIDISSIPKLKSLQSLGDKNIVGGHCADAKFVLTNEPDGPSKWSHFPDACQECTKKLKEKKKNNGWFGMGQ